MRSGDPGQPDQRITRRRCKAIVSVRCSAGPATSAASFKCLSPVSRRPAVVSPRRPAQYGQAHDREVRLVQRRQGDRA
eukprot:4698484-Heterocapsa_arctica.AAC.1